MLASNKMLSQAIGESTDAKSEMTETSERLFDRRLRWGR
jgi:hypothetical protein